MFFTDKIGEEILDRMAAGEPLLRICGPGRGRGMPDRQTVYHWLRKDEDFYSAYVRARGLGAQAIGEEIVEIADGREPEGGDLIEHRVSFGRQVPGTVPVRLAAAPRNVGELWVRITARRWLAGVMASAAHEARLAEGRALAAARDEGTMRLTAEREDEIAVAAEIAGVLEAVRRRVAAEKGREAGASPLQDLIDAGTGAGGGGEYGTIAP